MTNKIQIEDLTFCIFDLETTGGNHESDKIIEIGMVKLEKGNITAKKTFLIQPEMKIPDFIQKLTAITPNDVEDAPVIEDVIDEILEFMGDSILVAHNTSFDIPFLNSVLKRLKRDNLENKSLCTNLMTRYLIPNLLNTNLNYMSRIFGVQHSKAHRALDDAYATAELLKIYLEIFKAKGIKKINHLYYPQNKFELDRVNFKSSEHSAKDIIEILKTITPACLFSIKGPNGVIDYCYILDRGDKNISRIESKLKDNKWETATIRIFGSFVEAFSNFITLFTKMDLDKRKVILKELVADHIGAQKQGSFNNEESLEKFASEEVGDFIISHHLVPDQLIITPTNFTSPKQQLIFRYPGHQKKLQQFINSKISKIKAKKVKKVIAPLALKIFFISYLNKKKEDGEVFAVSYSKYKKNPDLLFEDLDHFISKYPNKNNYPKEYI